LAIPTEDHPLKYSDFERVIPEGEYGVGTGIVWDRGIYRTLTGKGKDRRWLLIKMNDREADARRNPVRTQPESILSGLTNEDMANQAKEGSPRGAYPESPRME
jgi:ATP-dependent DNA ligase